jgi:hypothetical protein
MPDTKRVTFGRVRNRQTGRILSPSGRYPSVTLSGRTVRIHALMAETFLGPRPRGAVVLHDDDDKRNTWILNLRYGTHRQNAADAKRHGVRIRQCHNGHRMTGDNVLVGLDGIRRCRQCITDAERRDPRAWRDWATGAVERPDDDRQPATGNRH